MKIKTLLIVSAIGIALATPESLQAQAKPKPAKPDFGDVKDDAKEGGKERPKFDAAKIKEIKDRLKTAFEKRKKDRGDAKKDGHKVKGKGGKKGEAFGKLVRDDEKIKELREAASRGHPGPGLGATFRGDQLSLRAELGSAGFEPVEEALHFDT